VVHGLVLTVARCGSRTAGAPLPAAAIAMAVMGKRADDPLVRS